MSDYMKAISDLDEVECRLKTRFEKRVEISNVVSVVRQTLETLERRVSEIDSEDNKFQKTFNNPHEISHREGKTSTSVEGLKAKQMIAEDVRDLLDQIDVLKKIVDPMSELLDNHRRSVKRLADYYPLTQSNLE